MKGFKIAERIEELKTAMAFEIRYLNFADEQEKRSFEELWMRTFHDDRDTVEDFLSAFSGSVCVFVVTDETGGNGSVVSALTQFKMGTLCVPRDTAVAIENTRSCRGAAGAMGVNLDIGECDVLVSYAICTDEKYRGIGLGSAITEHAMKSAIAEGAVSVLSPAEPSLVGFYEKIGYKPFFMESEKRVKAAQAEISKEERVEIGIGGAAAFELSAISQSSSQEYSCVNENLPKISSQEYNRRREEILKGVTHVRLSEELLSYIGTYSEFFGDDRGIRCDEEVLLNGERYLNSDAASEADDFYVQGMIAGLNEELDKCKKIDVNGECDENYAVREGGAGAENPLCANLIYPYLGITLG